MWGCCLADVGVPIVERRRPYDRLLSTVGFPVLVGWHLYIVSSPGFFFFYASENSFLLQDECVLMLV